MDNDAENARQRLEVLLTEAGEKTQKAMNEALYPLGRTQYLREFEYRFGLFPSE